MERLLLAVAGRLTGPDSFRSAAEDPNHAGFTLGTAVSNWPRFSLDDRAAFGAPMTAVIYSFSRPVENDATDDTAERLLSALGRYTSAELLELLYVGEEPGFFELMRGLFGLSDEGRMVLQNFLAASVSRRTTVSIDSQGRCVLAHDLSQDLAQDHPARDHRHQSPVRQHGPA